MNKDNLYIYDKKAPYNRSLLGEVQSGFNMSFVIDGTKDSCKCIVWGYTESSIEPYTIAFHEKTNTWWIVSHDKVERYTNENGFIYIHNLELLGAIELMNARDLTDCGFNQETYSFNDFIFRLIDLSNWEYGLQLLSSNIDTSKKVTFIKTYENYTLLSALREFLDAYNYAGYLTFETELGTNRLRYAQLHIVQKTGDYALTQHDIDDFDDVRETKTMDKNSFGTCVVSNAENVISKVTKTFPATGTVKCSSHEYEIKAENAVIRLPSKVFELNWLALCNTLPLTLGIRIEYDGVTDAYTNGSFNSDIGFAFNPFDDISFTNLINFIISHSPNPLNEEFLEYINSNYQYLKETLRKAYTIKLFNGVVLDAATGIPQKGDNMPYMVQAEFYSHADNEPFIVCDKETKQCLKKTWSAIAWERGSDELTGFDGFVPNNDRYSTIIINNFKYTDLQEEVATNNKTFLEFTATNGYKIKILSIGGIGFNFQDNLGGPANTQWIVNYYPMSDLKIKVDNDNDKNDTHLYNQNGKLTDNYALSKMINSYAKQISSDTITKFMFYRNYNDVPKVGSIVHNDDIDYVINNVSLTFTQNENNEYYFGYYIECEITMSKYCSTKSLMVNPYTNIRDYGIPQNFNVKRKQVYRDYYELNYSKINNEIPFLDYENVFDFRHTPNTDYNFIAVMKLEYDEEVNGDDTYYYQLETTVYDLNKMFYVVLDFKDNNIIGYGSENVWSGFVLSRVISGLIDVVNTPISYTDADGKVKNIDILLVDNETLTSAYYQYLTTNGYTGDNTYKKTLFNYSVFIPQDIYDLCYGNQSIRIDATWYYKDALEVPVFEYGCQAEDTTEVLIGEDIFRQHDNNAIYLYSFVEGTNLTQANVSASSSIINLTGGYYTILNSVEIEYAEIGLTNRLIVKKYASTDYNSNNGEFTDIDRQAATTGKDIAVFRHVHTPYDVEQSSVELLFIAKNVPSDAIDSDGNLNIIINNWKLE